MAKHFRITLEVYSCLDCPSVRWDRDGDGYCSEPEDSFMGERVYHENWNELTDSCPRLIESMKEE
jgi:hypothetical protein